MNRLQIGDTWVDDGAPCYIVAEMSANHLQRFERAIEIIRAARQAGANAVKLQTYTPDTMTIDSAREEFGVPDDSLWAGKTLYQLYAEAHTPWDWHPKLQAEARALGIAFFSTPFDASAVEFLERLHVPAYKIASFELVDIPLLQAVARTGKPVILSTGMGSMEEIREAVETLRHHGTRELALLKCTSAYPAAPATMNLRTIPDLAARFGAVAGLSDHTEGIGVAVAAVAWGARIIEKHLTLRRADGGPDSRFSLEPEEFAQMVREIRRAEQALGTVSYGRSAAEEHSVVFRRSLFIVQDVKQGERLSAQNVRAIRPGYGLHTRHLAEVLGKRAACEVRRGSPLRWDMVEREMRPPRQARSMIEKVSQEIRLRPATLDDAEFLLQVRNAPDVQHVSIRQRALTREELEIGSPDIHWRVVVRRDSPIGYVKISVTSGVSWIGVALISEARGKGYGRYVVEQATAYATTFPRQVMAMVRHGNVPALRVFLHAGYRLTDVQRDFLWMAYDGDRVTVPRLELAEESKEES